MSVWIYHAADEDCGPRIGWATNSCQSANSRENNRQNDSSKIKPRFGYHETPDTKQSCILLILKVVFKIGESISCGSSPQSRRELLSSVTDITIASLGSSVILRC